MSIKDFFDGKYVSTAQGLATPVDTPIKKKKEKKVKFSIKISHPDPKVEAEGAKAMLDLLKAIGKLTGEEIEIVKVKKT